MFADVNNNEVLSNVSHLSIVNTNIYFHGSVIVFVCVFAHCVSLRIAAVDYVQTK